MKTVSIIGTAGRREDASRMSKILYKRMVNHAAYTIAVTWGLEGKDITLVSGGAAWADHTAVSLYLLQQETHIKLYIPCNWDFDRKEYLDTGERDWKRNPGGTCNYYHRQFSKIMGGNTLNTLNTVMSLGYYEVIPGLLERNQGPASSDYLMAFTWSEGINPKDGGTKKTWDITKTKNKIHIPLSGL